MGVGGFGRLKDDEKGEGHSPKLHSFVFEGPPGHGGDSSSGCITPELPAFSLSFHGRTSHWAVPAPGSGNTASSLGLSCPGSQWLPAFANL